MYLLIEAIINHLETDSIMHKSVKCETYDEHPVRECARAIRKKITDYRRENPTADHIEIAFEILRLHLHASD